MLAYPWSSLSFYLAAREHRPAWIRTDRLFAAHGVKDSAAGRRLFEENMETRRRAESDDEEWKPLRRGWCLGSEQFKNQLLDQMAGEHHAGNLKRESAEARAERIIAEELRRLRWTQADLGLRLKSDPAKLEIAARLRRETTLTIKWIAARLHLRTTKSASTRLHNLNKDRKNKDNVMV